MTTNKIFAAILIAGIVAMVAGIAAEGVYHVDKLKQDAFPVVGVASAPAGGAPAAPAVIDPVAPLLAKSSAENGAKLAKVCTACHSLDSGGPNKVGPALWGVFGRARGTAPGYAYSDAVKAKGGSWDAEELNKFLAGPSKYIPGTKMGFAGFSKPQDRADVIKYLETLK